MRAENTRSKFDVVLEAKELRIFSVEEVDGLE